MFKAIPDLLTAPQVAQLCQIASKSNFVDGRISNPHSKVKQNLQLNEPNAHQQSSQVILQAMLTHEDFNNFVLPALIAPPLMTRYTKGMRYGSHFDVGFMQIGNGRLRSDISCTIFLSDPTTYEGGALCLHLGTKDVRFRGPPGSCILYPSDTLHEVEPVTDGERLVAITFIQSRVRNTAHRDIIYEVGEVAALEGNQMTFENLTRLQRVQQNLLRAWAE